MHWHARRNNNGQIRELDWDYVIPFSIFRRRLRVWFGNNLFPNHDLSVSTFAPVSAA
jgi:hypothetical protein